MNKAIVLTASLVMISCSSSHFIVAELPTFDNKNPIVVLDSYSIDLLAWERTNRNHDYEIDGGRVYVDLSSIRPAHLSEWLKVNNQYVLFNESLEGILSHHKIREGDGFSVGDELKSLTYQEIVDEFTRMRSPLKNSFKDYVEVKIIADEDLSLKYSSHFKRDIHHYYFSMAFFMAVANDIDYKPSTKFIFHRGIFKDNEVIIILVDDDGRKNYYDFAQYPPLR